VDCVWSNYREVTAGLMQHLLGLGHRRIGLIFGVASPTWAWTGWSRTRKACAPPACRSIPS